MRNVNRILGSFTLISTVCIPILAKANSVPLSDPIPEEITQSGLTVQLQEFVTLEPSSQTGPRARINFLHHANEVRDRLFVNDMRGKLHAIENGAVSTFLDIGPHFPDLVTGPSFSLGFGFFAFHPEFSSNGKLYTTHSEEGDALSTKTADYPSIRAEIQHWVITEWTAVDPAGDTFSGASRELLRVGVDTVTHGFQQIGFNPNAQQGGDDYGLLYIALGDGEQHPNLTDGPQNLGVPHGKMLRIDPLGTDSSNEQYGLQTSNPLTNNNGALGEIWAYGLRNPHRFSWDIGGSHKLFIGNIGEKNIESIYPGIAGANYGWSEREGRFLFDRNERFSVYPLPPNDDQNGYTYPVAQYDHDEGFAVVGGFVYRGSNVPELYGKYLFGDIVNGRIFYTDEADMVTGQEPAPIAELTLVDESLIEKDMLQFADHSRVDLRFGVDQENEIYVLAKQNGKIWRVAQVPVVCDSNVLSMQISGLNQWHLLSLPCDLPAGTTLGNLFVDGAPADGRWRAFRYEVAGPGGMYHELKTGDTLYAGTGFWFLTMDDPVTLEMPASSTQPLQAELDGTGHYTHSIAGDTSWNLLGNPGPIVIPYSDILLQNGQTNCSADTFCTLDDALNDENINTKLYAFNTSLSQYEIIDSTGVGTINPWDGFWARLWQGSVTGDPGSPWQLFYPAD